MKKANREFKLNTLAVAVIATCGSGAVLGNEGLGQYIDPDSYISLGAGQWSGDRQQQGIYDGMAPKGTYGLVDAQVTKLDRETGTWVAFKAKDLGLDPRYLRLDYLQQGNQGAYVEYSRITRDDPYTVYSRLQGLGTGRQIVNSNGAVVTSPTVDFKIRREITELGYNVALSDGLGLTVTFKNDEKSGNRRWGSGSNTWFISEPLNSSIHQLETTLSYTTSKLQLSGGYYGSWYRTANTLVDVSAANALATHMYMTLPLNNEAHQLFLNGGYTFTPSTRATFKLAYTRATQDETIPTTALGLASANAPRSLDAEVDTTLVQVGLTSALTSNLSMVANLRHHEVKDKTLPVLAISGSANANVQPYTYTTDSGSLEMTYRLPYEFAVTGGIETKWQDRPIPTVGNAARKVPYRAELDEDTYRLQLRRAMSETINGSVAYSHSERSGPAFSATDDATNQDRINPIHIADRARDKVRVALDWVPVENFNVQFTAENSRDDYDQRGNRNYGLREGGGAAYALDASYSFNEDWRITGWVSRDKTDATQANVRVADGGSGAGTKVVTPSESNDSIGLNFRGKAMPKVKVGGDLQYTRTKSTFGETITTNGQLFPTGATGPLPDVENRLVKVGLFAEYALDKSSDLRFDFVHERWSTDDWQWEFANGTAFSYGTTNDGTTIVATPKQISNFVGLRYQVKFQ